MVKKLLAVLLCIMAVLIFAGCAQDKKKDKEQNALQQNNIKNEQKENIENNENKENKNSKNEDLIDGIVVDIKPLADVNEDVLDSAAKTLGFENEKLFHAFANAIGKNPEEITKEDIDKVHYIAVSPGTKYAHTVAVGYVDYVDLCLSDARQQDNFAEMLSSRVMVSEFNYNIETDTLFDLGAFKNVEMFEIYNVAISDVSFVKNYNQLIYGYFRNNGITDVSSLEGYCPESLRQLDFTENEISDWTSVDAIKDKILVFYDISSGMSIDLETFLEQQQDPVEAPALEVPENNTKENDEYFIVDESGKPADFSSLFD